MNYLLIALGLIFIVAVVQSNKKRTKKVRECTEIDEPLDKSVTYSLKPVLTKSEIVFYKKLKIAINDKYHIYPQQSYRTFIKRAVGKDASYNTKRYAGELTYIADFLIVDKMTNIPIATIEKNDNTHYEKETKIRDSKKMELCKKAGIYYIAFWDYAKDEKTPYANDVDYIKNRLRNKGNLNLY